MHSKDSLKAYNSFTLLSLHMIALQICFVKFSSAGFIQSTSSKICIH